MKLSLTYLLGFALAASATAISPRQEDENDIDIGDACREGGVPRNMCGVMATFSLSTDIFAALIGEFNLQTGPYLVHTFDSDCNHLDSAAFEPQNPGFAAKLDDELGEITAKVSCFDIACVSGTTVPRIEVEAPWAPIGVICEDETEWIDGISLYAYRMCTYTCVR